MQNDDQFSLGLAEALQTLNDKFSAINCGGCGLVAYGVSRTLDKWGVPHSIMSEYNPSEYFPKDMDLNEAVALVTSGEIDGYLAPNRHLFIKLDGITFDAEQVNDELHTSPYEKPISPGALKQLLKIDVWNASFKYHNDDLANPVKDLYKDVCKVVNTYIIDYINS